MIVPEIWPHQTGRRMSHIVRSPVRFLALTFTLALFGWSIEVAQAAPPAATVRTGATKTNTPARRAKTDVPAISRPGRTSKTTPTSFRTAEPPGRADSVGPPNEGRLEGGIRLDISKPYLRGAPMHPSVDTHWGLPALVHALDHAAKAVAKKHPGSVLNVGDLSRRHGGELPRHHSHESGRDADIGFYVVDKEGKPLSRANFVKIDDKLAAEDIAGARFDVAKNWLFLQNLLLDRDARVSHVFVAEPLKKALLAHARSRGVAHALYVRASLVMMQPTGGLPHDDHFHVRISCPSSMRKTCVEYAKNAPSKARLSKKAKQRAAMRTPPRSPAKDPKTNKATPNKAAPGTRTASTNTRPGGIFLSRTAKAAGDPDVPASLWALADAALGTGNDAAPRREAREEAESDNVDVKEALDESGETRITR
jgi:penicillin-insensitive murein DD-endopeptidase